MNKKQFAILSNGNVLQNDAGIALYASKYLELNYSFTPSVDIILAQEANILDVLTRYEDVIVLDVIGIDDNPGSLYNFPMDQFRSLGTDESPDESDENMGVLESLNFLEKKGETLPNVTLLAIVPDTLEEKIGLSPILHHSFEAYMLMITKTLEEKGIVGNPIENKIILDGVIESFKAH